MRVCVLVGAIAFGVFAVPATARAADPYGTAQLLQEAGAAVSDAQALATQETAPSSTAVAAVSAAIPASASTGSVPTSASAGVAAVKTEAMATVTEAVVSAGADMTSGKAAPPTQRPASRPTPHRHRGRAAVRAHPRAAPSRPGRWGERAVPGRSSARAIGGAPPAAPSRATPRGRGRDTQSRSAGSVSHRLPPVPLPPQDLNAAGQAGGPGTLAPLLVGALATALLVAFLQFLSRLLPRSAFRKPRRLALLPWHPG